MEELKDTVTTRLGCDPNYKFFYDSDEDIYNASPHQYNCTVRPCSPPAGVLMGQDGMRMSICVWGASSVNYHSELEAVCFHRREHRQHCIATMYWGAYETTPHAAISG